MKFSLRFDDLVVGGIESDDSGLGSLADEVLGSLQQVHQRALHDVGSEFHFLGALVREDDDKANPILSPDASQNVVANPVCILDEPVSYVFAHGYFTVLSVIFMSLSIRI